MTNSVDPDQTPRSAASDLVYTVCQDLSVQTSRLSTAVLSNRTLSEILNPLLKDPKFVNALLQNIIASILQVW